jgi:hypothetical protein
VKISYGRFFRCDVTREKEWIYIDVEGDGFLYNMVRNIVGSLVKKDEVLASFYSPEFLGAQQAYLYALGAMDRFQASGKETPQQIDLTKANIQQYKDSLSNLGMGYLQIEEIARTRQYAHRVHILSPATGFVLGVLFAPASGKDTRKKIGEEVGKTSEKAKEASKRSPRKPRRASASSRKRRRKHRRHQGLHRQDGELLQWGRNPT